jgi:hypothetical protein
MSHAAAPARPAPAAAPAKSGGPEKESTDPTVLTAERLFVELASRALIIGDNSAKLPVDAKSLANLSFELAKAFHEIEVGRREKPVLTTATFDANMCDFDAWNTAATAPKAA